MVQPHRTDVLRGSVPKRPPEGAAGRCPAGLAPLDSGWVFRGDVWTERIAIWQRFSPATASTRGHCSESRRAAPPGSARPPQGRALLCRSVPCGRSAGLRDKVLCVDCRIRPPAVGRCPVLLCLRETGGIGFSRSQRSTWPIVKRCQRRSAKNSRNIALLSAAAMPSWISGR